MKIKRGLKLNIVLVLLLATMLFTVSCGKQEIDSSDLEEKSNTFCTISLSTSPKIADFPNPGSNSKLSTKGRVINKAKTILIFLGI